MKVKYLVLYFFLHITSLGYLAQLRAQCSGTTVLTNHAATFEDGSGTANYQNKLNCGWRIAVPGATRIEFTITGNTQATYDYLKVFNGYDATAPLLATVSGSFVNYAVNSTSGTVFINFVTNASIVSTGWSITYRSADRFEYEYDDAGNRKKRFVVFLPPPPQQAPTDSSLEQPPQQESQSNKPIDEYTQSLGNATVAVYPNPTNALLQVKINRSETQKSPYSLAVYNLTGQLVYQSNTADQNTAIPFTDKPAGIYILKIAGDGQTLEWKIVKE